ncbi:MAG: hypothetical protein D3925_14460 [Candidatus Electrothrix sp. AR5]|nr:hypothetical protein [Candidatus Electrothrix sp. AR5]
MAERCFGNVSLPENQRDAITVAKWIIANKPKTINSSDFRRMRGSPLRETKRIEEAFEELIELNWIKFTGGRDGENGGRQKQDYEINPRLWEVLKNE